MKDGKKRLVPWMEKRREFFVAQPPVFRCGEFRAPPYSSFFTSDNGSVLVARRSDYVGIMSKMHGGESIIVKNDVWARFLNGLREGQFDGTHELKYEVQMTLLEGEIAVRMQHGSCSKEEGVLTFSKAGWKIFLEGAKEKGTFYDK